MNKKREEIMNGQIEQLKKIIDESNNIVFFGGAGVSTESGIPDFRSVDGLYNQKYDYPPETILSHSFYYNKTEIFYQFYRDKMLYLDDFVAVLISIYITRHILQLLVSKFKKNSKYFVLVYENTPMGEAVQSSDDSEEENVEIELQENPEVQ